MRGGRRRKFAPEFDLRPEAAHMLFKRLLQVALFLVVSRLSVAEALVAPSGLTASPYSAGSIALGWVGTSQGNVNYVIERSTSATAGFAVVGSTAWTET